MSTLTPGQKVAAYIKLRDYIKAAEDEFKAGLARPKAAMEKLEGELLNDLNTSDTNSMKCEDGTVYKSIKLSATVENREAFKVFVIENDLWEAMDIKANKTFVKEYMDKEGKDMPGLKITQLATIGVRRS